MLIEEDEQIDADMNNLGISAELLEKEREYRRINKELKSKTKQVVKKVEETVQEGKEALRRPISQPTMAIAAENDDGPSAPSTRQSNDKQTIFLEPSDWGLSQPKQTSSGVETANKLLRAKVTQQQQEIDKLIQERDQRDGKIQNLEEITKSGEDEKKRLNKMIVSLQSQVEKSKKSLESLKKTNMDNEIEIQALRKDIDVLDREKRQTHSETNNKDVKLNRALQELDKYKSLLAKASSDSKEKLESTKKAADKMFADNSRLMKQKQDLLLAFKKQSQLIDVLKKQKLHLESSKLLEFTEEEFMRILESR